MNPNVTPWTINLSRLSDFWEPQIVVVDEQGFPVTYTSTQITITPEEGLPVVWNPANGRLTIPSAGVFAVSVPKTDIAAYLWDKATYKWSVTYSNGKVDGVWMEGTVRVSD